MSDLVKKYPIGHWFDENTTGFVSAGTGSDPPLSKFVGKDPNIDTVNLREIADLNVGFGTIQPSFELPADNDSKFDVGFALADEPPFEDFQKIVDGKKAAPQVKILGIYVRGNDREYVYYGGRAYARYHDPSHKSYLKGWVKFSCGNK